MSSIKTYLKRTYNFITKLFGSKTFFVIMLVFFYIQAMWIAIIGLFPMAFDEETHLNIIKFFTNHPNPFFNQQPSYLNQYGAVVHDPSYLYRYVMSFPWRIISQITDNFTTQVILMRFINIGLFVIGLIIIRKLLFMATDNKLLINLALLLVILTPISSQLAAQINYDNLFIPLYASSLVLAIKFVKKLKQNKIDLWLFAWFVVIATAASLTKFTYLTILLPILGYIGWHILQMHKSLSSKFWLQVGNSFKKLKTWQSVVLIVLFLICGGLLFERYGMNIIRYQTPTPDCVKVIGETNCQSFSIYQRSILYAQTKPTYINKNPMLFTYRWLKHMNYNLIMALSGPSSGYSVGQPLPLPYKTSIIFGIGGILLCIIYFRKVFNNSVRRLLIIVLLFYLVPLWLTNYISYIDTGRRVAIQGRYLVPLLPIIYLFFLLAFRQLLIKWPKIRFSLATILIFGLMLGGGAETYILHSDSTWYWVNPSIKRTNNNVKNVIRYVAPGWGSDDKPYWQSSFSF